MITFLTILIALICILLMGAVLIQNPKGGGLDATFGGAGNQMFGAAKSADFIEKATWVLASALLVLCLATSLIIKYGGGTNNGGRSTRTEQGYNAPIKTPQQDLNKTYYL